MSEQQQVWEVLFEATFDGVPVEHAYVRIVAKSVDSAIDIAVARLRRREDWKHVGRDHVQEVVKRFPFSVYLCK